MQYDQSFHDFARVLREPNPVPLQPLRSIDQKTEIHMSS